MQQRRDIQGLRAYAVVAVLLYHFGVPGFGGGFAGVDVFFVISGFLMSNIILRGLSAGQFSLWKFYLARARRIIPALAVLCVTLLALGWFWLAPSDYAQLGWHAAGAGGFFTNFIFMDESGYFDAPSHSKWLLHTWSLAVEWQFYLLYPLLLMAVAALTRRSRLAFGITLLLVTILSFIACALLTRQLASFSFFMLPIRAWELAAGGLVYHYAPVLRARVAWLAEVAGILLILASVHSFSNLTSWPGAYAALPVLGAMLVLLGARQNSLLTGTRVAQWLGSWSYSIYLWHWPIVVGLGYFTLEQPQHIALGIAASILLGALSYRFIEQPARRITGSRRTALLAVGVTALLIGAGLLISRHQGFPSRVSETVRVIDRESTNRIAPMPDCGFSRSKLTLTPCIVGDSTNIRWVVLGDSHAGTILHAVAAAHPKDGILYYTHACATLFDTELKSKGATNHCTEFNRSVAEQVAKLPHDIAVIVANRYSSNVKGPNEGLLKLWGFVYRDMSEEAANADPYALYTKRLTDTLCSYAHTRPVYAVAPIPEIGRNVPKTMVHAAMTGRDATDVTLPRTEYNERNDVVLSALALASRQCGVHVLDPTPYLCDEQVCHGARDGRPLYSDDNHLSESGNRVLIPMFTRIFH